jgi:hypothetical protein
MPRPWIFWHRNDWIFGFDLDWIVWPQVARGRKDKLADAAVASFKDRFVCNLELTVFFRHNLAFLPPRLDVLSGS